MLIQGIDYRYAVDTAGDVRCDDCTASAVIFAYADPYSYMLWCEACFLCNLAAVYRLTAGVL